MQTYQNFQPNRRVLLQFFEEQAAFLNLGNQETDPVDLQGTSIDQEQAKPSHSETSAQGHQHTPYVQERHYQQLCV